MAATGYIPCRSPCSKCRLAFRAASLAQIAAFQILACLGYNAADETDEDPTMSQAVTLQLPEEVYQHVRRAAKAMKEPVEKALVDIVKAATPSLAKVPVAFRAELEAMEDSSDADLREF